MDISREEYREYDAINYSKLASLDKHPSKVNEEKDFSDGIQNGDLLDLFCYDGEDAVHEKYYVSSITQMPSDAIKEIIEQSPDFSEAALLHTARDLNYGASNWKDSTILNKITENGGGEYMMELENAAGRPIINFETFAEMQQASNLLKNHPFTKDMFGHGWEHQKPLVAQLHIHDGDPVTFKGLLDGIKVDKDRDMIFLHDLKYMSSPLSYFPNDFKKWRYYLQASLYSDIVREIYDMPTVWYNVVYSSLENKVQKFLVTEDMIIGGRKGFHDISYGRKGYCELAEEYLWHVEHDKWDYPRDVYLNNGVETIDLPKVLTTDVT